MQEKLLRLREVLRRCESVLVAYSGGVDSSFLLKVASDELGGEAVALTALSPSFPSYELERTKGFARELGVRHLLVQSAETDIPEYRANRGDRCYFCKTDLYEICRPRAEALGLKAILNGTNVDDLSDIRPGLRAAAEQGIRSPLVEAGLTKGEIREIARSMGLPFWDRPAMACLSSRFPIGTEVTPERLARIDRIESGLARLGFRTFRVRFHEPVARIELALDEIPRLNNPLLRKQVVQLCRENGFARVAFDRDGYRPGGASAPPGRLQFLS